MENTGDCQFEVLRSVAFFNCDRFKGETEAEGLEFSGFVNSAAIWVASGSHLRIFNTQLGTLIGSWSFVEGSVITCVSQRPNSTENLEPHLLIGLTRANDVGTLCCFDLTKCRVVKSVLLPYKISALDCFEGKNITGFDKFSDWELIALAGTEEAHVYLCDMTVRDPLSSSDLNPIRIKPVPYSQISQTYPMNTCVELKLGSHTENEFIWSDGQGRRSFQKYNVSVSCVRYFTATESIAIGYDFGCYQYFCLKSGDIKFTSLYSVNSDFDTSVVQFALQEPENDPRHVVFLWVVREKTFETENENNSNEYCVDQEMWQLHYESKRISQFGYKYESFEMHHCRFANTLEDSTNFVCCQTVINPLCNDSRQEGNDSVLPDGVSICDSSLIYFCWKTTGGSPMVGLFDLNGWYHAQMPSELVRYMDVCPFFATVSLSTVPQNILHLFISPRTVKRFCCINNNSDMEYFPVALSYDCALITSRAVTIGKVRSIQASIIYEIEQRGYKVLDSPREMLILCRSFGLLPSSASSCDFLLMSLDDQRQMLLTVMLESGCVTFLLSCVSAFCKVPAGLILMTTWAFSTVSKIKATLDSHNDILFDSGGLELADSQRQMFELNINMLESVALVFRHCLSIAEQLDLRETFVADLSHRMATISLILEYARLVLWLISQNLLPAADDGKAFGQNSRIERLISDRRGQKTLANFLLETVAMPIAEFWTSEHSWNQILPPPSYSALCGAYLIDRVPLGAKHFLTLYYLLDIYGDRETWNFDRSEAFNRRFICGSTSPWLYDFSLAVWLIDAGDFVVGKSHFLRALNRGGSWSESPSLWSDLFTEIWKRLGSPSASLTHSLVINEAKRPESDFEQIYSVLSTAKHMEETGDISGATAYLKRNFTEKSLVKLVDFKYDSEMEKWLKDQIFTHGWNGLTGSEALFWFSSRRAQYKDAVDSQNRQKIGKRRAEDSSCETLAKRLEDILPECRYAKLRKVGPSSLEMILQSFTNTAEVNVLSADISTATTSTLCRTASEEICKQLRTATPRRNINSPNVSPLKQFTPPKVNEASDLTQTLTDLFALTESGRKLSVEKSKLLLAVNPQEHRTKLSEIQSLLATPPAVGRTKSLGLGSSGLRVFPAAPILRLRETSPISTHSSGQKHLRFDLPRDSPAESSSHIRYPKASHLLSRSQSPGSLTDSFERVERWECATPDVLTESRCESSVSYANELSARLSPPLVRPNLELMDRLLGEAKSELKSARVEPDFLPTSSSHSEQSEMEQSEALEPLQDENEPPTELTGNFAIEDQMFLSEEEYEETPIKPTFSATALAVNTMQEAKSIQPQLDLYDEMFLSDDEMVEKPGEIAGLYDILEADELFASEQHSPPTASDTPALQLTGVPTTPEVPIEQEEEPTDEIEATKPAENPAVIIGSEIPTENESQSVANLVDDIKPPVSQRAYPLRSRTLDLSGVDEAIFLSSSPIIASLQRPKFERQVRSSSVASTHSTDSAEIKSGGKLKLYRRDRRSRIRSECLGTVGIEEFDSIAVPEDRQSNESESDGKGTNSEESGNDAITITEEPGRMKKRRTANLRMKLLRKDRKSLMCREALEPVDVEEFNSSKLLGSPATVSLPSVTDKEILETHENADILPSTSNEEVTKETGKMEVTQIRPVTPDKRMTFTTRVLRSATKAEPMREAIEVEANGTKEVKPAHSKGRKSPARPESPARTLRSNANVITEVTEESEMTANKAAPSAVIMDTPATAATTKKTRKLLSSKNSILPDQTDTDSMGSSVSFTSKYPLRRYDRERAAASEPSALQNGTTSKPPGRAKHRGSISIKSSGNAKVAMIRDSPAKMPVPKFAFSSPNTVANMKEEMTLQEDPQAEYSFSKPLSKSKKTSGSKKNEEKEDSTETKKSRERRRNTVGGSQF